MGLEFKNVLVTGVAGFIGFHLAYRLLKDGYSVVGIDNLNPYYDVNLKKDRLKELEPFSNFQFHGIDLSRLDDLAAIFKARPFDVVVNLAAQAGVRYSLENPHAYVDANLVGFVNLLECCRHYSTKHLVFASSSSVYGANTRMPFSVHDNVDHPVSLYAATRKSNELLAHTYSHLFGLPTTGLRFFTVYGPWGRPDMALFLFTRAILADEPIQVFNQGNMLRDFTYIDDIIEGVVRVTDQPARPNPNWNPAAPDPGTSSAPYRLYNIGNNTPVSLHTFIQAIENSLGKQAIQQLLPMQPGDVAATCADIDDLFEAVGYRPATDIEEGVERFVAWYREYTQKET